MDRERKLKLLKAKQAQTVDAEQVDQLAESLSHQLVKEVQESPIIEAVADSASEQRQVIENTKEEILAELDKRVQELKASYPQPVDKVEITNLNTLLNQLKLVQESVNMLTIPDQVEVKNFPEVKAPIVNVEKAVDDIYARYDYAADSVEIDGQYIGYLSQKGNWFIQRIAKGVHGNMSTFAVGKGDFTAAWIDKMKLDYKMRDEVVIP